jgi:excisionase family DNA binding protein
MRRQHRSAAATTVPAVNGRQSPASALLLRLDGTELQTLIVATVAETLRQLGPVTSGPSRSPETAKNPEAVLLTRRLAAQRLGVSTGTLDALVKAGRLRPVMVGRSPRFAVTELDRFAGGKG